MSAEVFMELALAEAAKGRGRTSPNPPVGAVLVRDGQVIAKGHHRQAGGPHAEAEALAAAGERAAGAELYVTLEPCVHQGRTVPCVPALLEAGVAQVFVGTIDPNPKVSGRGVRLLEEAGVPVQVGVCEAACRALIAPWSHFMRTGRPYVTLKVAMSLDGRIALASGESRWITSETSRAYVHGLRDVSDAVLVGRGTVEKDDPLLNVRLPGGRDPLRVVLDSGLRMSPQARMLRQDSAAGTWIACDAGAPAARAAALEAAGAKLLRVGRTAEARLDLPGVLEALGAAGVVELLVEGGSEVFASFLEAGLVDRLLIFIAPKVLGSGPAWAQGPVVERLRDAFGFDFGPVRRMGEDLLIEATPRRTR